MRSASAGASSQQPTHGGTHNEERSCARRALDRRSPRQASPSPFDRPHDLWLGSAHCLSFAVELAHRDPCTATAQTRLSPQVAFSAGEEREGSLSRPMPPRDGNRPPAQQRHIAPSLGRQCSHMPACRTDAVSRLDLRDSAALLAPACCCASSMPRLGGNGSARFGCNSQNFQGWKFPFLEPGFIYLF